MGTSSKRRNLPETDVKDAEKDSTGVASAYRTTSLKAIQVVTDTVPIHLRIVERERLYRTKNGRLEKEREVSLRELLSTVD